MKLKLYIIENGFNVKQFAELLGCSRMHLSNIIHGRIKAGKFLAQAIENITDGAIKASDILFNKKHETKNHDGNSDNQDNH